MRTKSIPSHYGVRYTPPPIPVGFRSVQQEFPESGGIWLTFSYIYFTLYETSLAGIITKFIPGIHGILLDLIFYFIFRLAGITRLTGRHVNAQIKVLRLEGIEHSTSGSLDTQNSKLNSSATEPIKVAVRLLTLLLTKVSSHSNKITTA